MVQFESITKKIKKRVLTISLLAFWGGFLMGPLLSIFQNGLLAFDINIEDSPSSGYESWISSDGVMFAGKWMNGDLEKGMMITGKGVYEGEFQDLQPHGYGVMYYNNGNVYQGNWKYGKKNGIGLKINNNDTLYFGEWEKDDLVSRQSKNSKRNEPVYGIDLSKYQPSGSLEWNNFSLYSDEKGRIYSNLNIGDNYCLQPVSFVFIKATQGSAKDPCYEKHQKMAREYKKIIGAYHFFTISVDVNQQVINFINTVKWQKGDLPPVLDLESEYSNHQLYVQKLKQYGIQRMQNEALKWLEIIEKYYGVRPIVYTSEAWKNNCLKDDRFSKYDFWIARYNQVGPSMTRWKFWQSTCTGKLNGYNRHIDIDIFNGSYHDFLNYRNTIVNL